MRVTCVDARILLYEYKYAVRRCMPPLKPSVLAAPGGDRLLRHQHHGEPLAKDRIYNHIENPGG